MNFAVESFIDELAAASSADPIAFRLQQLQNSEKVAAVVSPTFDPANYRRTTAMLEELRKAMSWQSRPSPGPGAKSKSDVVTGRGIAAMGNYTNVFGAMGAEVEVNRKTGKVRVTRLVNTVDAGLIINPRSARNVVEQGVIFALSRTLHEDVKFDQKAVLSKDWVSYPILRLLGRRTWRGQRNHGSRCRRECNLRRYRRTNAIGAVHARESASRSEKQQQVAENRIPS
jgi:CO/xanthine dehydrogenase Mo-binding subunit